MTSNNPNAPTAPAFRLTVLQGPDRGKTFDLLPGRDYLVGRAEECDIRIDVSDKTVSRRHAVLKITARRLEIQNLSTTNPVQMKGKPVSKAAVTGKNEFQVGESLFLAEKTVASPAGNGGIPHLRIILIALLVGMMGFLAVILLSGDKSPPPQATISSSPPASPLPVRPGPAATPQEMTLPTAGLGISADEMKQADQHFRQGMFFYDAGNLPKAVEEWNRAVILNPDHPDAQGWFLRAERELEETIKTHYQNAMLHYKYMRYTDAAHEFRLVVELSRDKASDQYVNALKLMSEIENR